MNTQQQIQQVQTAIAALDNQISQIQSALNSPSTTGDDVLALRSTLVQLQAQRSALMTTLINLQASSVQGDALPATAATAQNDEATALHVTLTKSITDNTIVKTTLAQATAVKDQVTRLQTHLSAQPRVKSAG
jgi:outer membrane protein W